MYPGYSPADHIYGTAAMEYGSAAAKAKAQGIELKPHNDMEYEIGQGKGMKRKKLAEMQALRGSQGVHASGVNAINKTKESEVSQPKPAENAVNGDQPAFFIDTEPTPVNLPIGEKSTAKDGVPGIESAEGKELKRVKKSHEGKLPDAPPKGQIETEDISAEVDARLKAKEEKRRKKEEKKRTEAAQSSEPKAIEQPDTAAEDKKRKRLSNGSPSAVADHSEVAEKPKKKKSRKDKGAESGMVQNGTGTAMEGVEPTAAKEIPKEQPENAGQNVSYEEQKKKKSKKVSFSEPSNETNNGIQASETAIKEPYKPLAEVSPLLVDETAVGDPLKTEQQVKPATEISKVGQAIESAKAELEKQSTETGYVAEDDRPEPKKPKMDKKSDAVVEPETVKDDQAAEPAQAVAEERLAEAANAITGESPKKKSKKEKKRTASTDPEVGKSDHTSEPTKVEAEKEPAEISQAGVSESPKKKSKKGKRSESSVDVGKDDQPAEAPMDDFKRRLSDGSISLGDPEGQKRKKKRKN